MLFPANPNPIAYDYLASIVAPNVEYTPENVAQIAKDFIKDMQNAPDLASHCALQARDPSEIDLVRRIVKYYEPETNQKGKSEHQSPLKDPDMRMNLDRMCLQRLMQRNQSKSIEHIKEDGRFLAISKYALGFLIGCSKELRCIEDVLNGIGIEIVTHPEYQSWYEWLSTFTAHLSEKFFQVYWMQALKNQQEALPGCYLINLDPFIEVSNGRVGIQELYQAAEQTFVDTDEHRDRHLRQLKGVLEDLFLHVCNELHEREILTILEGFESVWNRIGDRMAPEVRVWMCAFIDHLTEVAQDAGLRCTAYLVNLIYQMRNIQATDGCENRILYEWSRLMMLYWNYVFSPNDARRMDWIAMSWKQDFLLNPVKRLLKAVIKEGVNYPEAIELEIYRGHEVHYDSILHFGVISEGIAYEIHQADDLLYPEPAFFDLFFRELHSLTQGPVNGWVDYALTHCPATRMQYGMHYTSERLQSRFECWIAGGLQSLCNIPLSDRDIESVRHSMSHHYARHIQGAELQPFLSHAQSVRHLLAPYIQHPGYPKAEGQILISLSILQDDATTEQAHMDAAKQVIDAVWALNESYEADHKAKAREPLLEVALKAGVMRLVKKSQPKAAVRDFTSEQYARTH